MVSLAYTPDGTLVAAGTYFGAIQLFRISDETPAGTLWVGRDEVTSVDVSPDGKRLVAVSRDEVVRILDLAGAAPAVTLAVPFVPAWPRVRKAVIAADGSTVLLGYAFASGGSHLGRFRARDGERVASTEVGPSTAAIAQLAISPDRAVLATVVRACRSRAPRRHARVGW